MRFAPRSSQVWVAGRCFKGPAQQNSRRPDANAALEDEEAVLLTWGFHQYFHGKLTRADLDRISATRPSPASFRCTIRTPKG